MTTAMARSDFWQSSGFFMLERDADGQLLPTDDFLRAYLSRPEVAPVPESCPAEIALHRRLIEDPCMPVSAAEIAGMADADARDSYQVVLRFRDGLKEAGSLEAWYISTVRDGVAGIPPLFLDHIAHAVLRGMLDGCGDPIRARAAELFFRTQKVTLKDGAILMADEEIVDQFAQAGGMSPIAQLMAQAGSPMATVDLDVLDRDNGDLYWDRSDSFDTVLDLTFARPGLDAFCRVMEGWVAHFLGAEVQIQPVQSIKDDRWVWHTGLDLESSAVLNDLYEGNDVDDERLGRLLSLFRLEFKDRADMLDRVAGAPVYLGLAMAADGVVRMKPQNLLLNLPLARAT